MPELPEVETIRTALEPEIVGRRIDKARTFPCPKFTEANNSVGYRIGTLKRRGKYLIAALEAVDTNLATEPKELIIHLGMTGTLKVTPAAQDPTESYEPAKHDRASWTLDNGRTLIFNDVRRFGRIRVVTSGDYSTITTLAKLGPEPFDPAFTPESLYRALKASKRHIKTQLLSQRPVAGLGNIYADEALWLAQIRPNARRVTKKQAQALHQSCVEVLRIGVENGGTTLRNYRQPDGSTGSNQHQLNCYGRAGLECPRCKTTLKATKLDGRSTTWCPKCQRS